MGFSRRWINWISIILSTASTKVLINGWPGRRICHARGLRQGDPLSPMLFVIAMEALNAMFTVADSLHLFTQLRPSSIQFRASLYADDVVVFVVPVEQDLKLCRTMLDLFAGASGLATNIKKCHFTPIRCAEHHIALVQRWFPCNLTHFPFNYLGIPLLVYQLRKPDLQPLVDRVANRLPLWKSRLLAKAGRSTLTKVTLTAIPIHISIAVALNT